MAGRLKYDAGAKDGGIGISGVASILVLVLVIGLVIGLFRGSGGPEEDTSVVIDRTVAVMDNAPKSEEGAVRAATGFVTGFVDLVALNDVDRRVKLSLLVDPKAPSSLKNDMRKLLEGFPRFSPDSRRVSLPVAYKVDMLGDDVARVQIWGYGMITSAGDDVAIGTWETNLLKLTWAGNRWRISEWTVQAGPTPPYPEPETAGPPASPDDLLRILKNFKEYRHATAR